MNPPNPPDLSVGRKPRGQPAGHIDALDGVRGLAILLVLAHHFLGYEHGFTRWSDPVFEFLQLGWCGVDLFFVLSGFLITGILLKTKLRGHYFRNFYMRRTLRIFPLYYGCLAVILILLPAIGFNVGRQPGMAGQGWYWLYGTNLLISLQGSWETTGSHYFRIAHFWSLAVEEHFYLVWPLIVYFIPVQKLWKVCVALVIAVLGLRSAWFLWTHDWMTADIWTPFRIDTLVIGGLAALAVNSSLSREAIRRHARRLVWIVGAAILVAILLGLWNRETSPFVSTLGYTLLAAGFAALILTTVLAEPRHWLNRFFSASILRFFGRYSYGIYIYHMFVLATLTEFSTEKVLGRLVHSSLGGMLVARLLALAITVGVSMLSWHLFEKQFLKLKRYFE